MTNEYNIYETEVSTPTSRDPREINVVNKINELKDRVHANIEDDTVEVLELKRVIDKILTEIDSTGSQVDTVVSEIGTTPQGHTLSGDIAALNTAITGLSPKRVYCIESFIEDANTESSTTEELYETLKTNLEKGDICIGEIHLSDGPAGDTEHVGIFAYATEDNITDGENIYSRVYIIASLKTTPPYIWWYHNSKWRSIMLLNEYQTFTMKSSTEGSTKKFTISVNDSGTITATEII